MRVNAVSIPIWCDYKKKKRKMIKIDIEFQFQYGAIIRNASGGFIGDYSEFQFQYGAIISPYCC